jgi:hypothetical protein
MDHEPLLAQLQADAGRRCSVGADGLMIRFVRHGPGSTSASL